MNRQNKTKGGGLLNDIADLAIPFGLVIAERGLNHLLNDQKEKKNKKPQRKSNQAQKGGKHHCYLCMQNQRGGESSIENRRSLVQKQFSDLAVRLNNLL